MNFARMLLVLALLAGILPTVACNASPEDETPEAVSAGGAGDDGLPSGTGTGEGTRSGGTGTGLGGSGLMTDPAGEP